MKKTIFVFVLILLMSASVNAFAADDVSLDFIDSQWSESNLYPEWYGGRYLDDAGRLTYVIVKGYEDDLGTFLSENTYVVKERSYNTLLRTLDEITREWMSVQSADEPVCIQSAWLDEVNNIIVVEFYTGSDNVEEMRERLIQHFGGLIDTSTTNDLITLDSKLMDKVDNTWIWFTSVAMMMVLTGTILVWRKRSSLVLLRQAVGGGTENATTAINTKETLSTIKEASITPDDSVFDRIMRDIK